MTRDEALHTITSSSPHEHLKAARFLAQNAHPSDLQVLRRARQAETVSYVKRSLDVAVERLSNVPRTAPRDPADELNVPDDVRQQIMTQAIERVTRLLLHEISQPIGLLRQSATREVSDYEKSRTKRYLDHLTRICEGVEHLTNAASPPRPEQFDLAELLAHIAENENVGKKVDISFQGPNPMLITSDARLLHLAICNGLRNAIEAVIENAESEFSTIIVTWGMTDVDYWIAVVDDGPGLSGSIESVFEIGKSSKPGHSGFGLATAKQAMLTLGGTVTLQPAVRGGTRYELRWGR